MKKQIKRLSLSRETINLLDGDTLAKVNGGIIPILSNKADGCSVNYCATDSCVKTSCY
jgi:hypothetical protein